ncbi:MAG: alpha/beta hydrolase [Hyphomicrobium sp.]|nr:alpha/beta hydrolase [Hyphomicrobium sp.]
MRSSRSLFSNSGTSSAAPTLPAIPDRQNWRDIFFTSRDGLRLYARHYPAPGSSLRPVLCLPGLTRNSRDFHQLASVLSSPQQPAPRHVYTVDYRGRGRSAYDPDWRNYQVMNELLDVLDFMTIEGLSDTAIVGTSRGGILAMIMAAVRPSSIGAVVLNDIGPLIEREGLLRIVSYVGRIPLPATWAEAGELARSMGQRQYPAVPDDMWEELARQQYNDEGGRPAYGYDQELNRTASIMDGPLPELWPQFKALSRVPVLVLRGELSDILSTATAERMQREHPDLTLLTVPEQGHAPLLRDEMSLRAIMDFLARADVTWMGRHIS